MAEENEDDGKVTFKSTDVFSDSVTSRHFSYGEYRLDEATAKRLQGAGKGHIVKEEKAQAKSSEKSNDSAKEKSAKEKGESSTAKNKSLKSNEVIETESNQGGGEGDDTIGGSNDENDITNQVNSTAGLTGEHNQGSENTNEVNGAKVNPLPEKFPHREELEAAGVNSIEHAKQLGADGLSKLKLSKAKVNKIGLAIDEFEKSNEQK